MRYEKTVKHQSRDEKRQKKKGGKGKERMAWTFEVSRELTFGDVFQSDVDSCFQIRRRAAQYTGTPAPREDEG